MKQLLQNLSDGETFLAEAPCPLLPPGHLLIRTRMSLVSAGTERMLREFGRASLLSKALQQPERVRQVLDKVWTDGLFPTIAAIRSKLAQPIPLGYSNAGVVLEVGEGVTGFKVGDRVVSNGPHAEVVSVPSMLCVRIPDSVEDAAAAFTVIASIALHGVRLANPTLGERFAVFGLGLIGLLAVQILRAQGCRVLGLDLDPCRLELAQQFGATTVNLAAGEDPLAAASSFSAGQGIDGVLIAATTKSSDPIHQAAMISRKRGRIILLGVTGLELRRSDFYEKELTFQVSCSYGPGRYDPLYEKEGQDYPLPYVRWTERRNFEAVLGLLAEGKLNPKPLISHTIPFASAPRAYEILESDRSALGVLLEYATPKERADEELRKRTVILRPTPLKKVGSVVVAFVGAGNYARQVLIPAFRRAGAVLHSVTTQSAEGSAIAARRFGFAKVGSDASEAIRDPEVNAVVIATRHDSHARLVREALEAGKHVFVEKPLCLTREELASIEAAYAVPGRGQLLVDFNRRFSPLTQKGKELLATTPSPKSIVMMVNAGPIPSDHWLRDPAVGGGPLLGEGCHFVDLLRYLVDAPILEIRGFRLGGEEESASVTFRFADGSIGTLHYFTQGDRSYPKERLEIFCEGKILLLDNFRVLRGYGWPSFQRYSLWSQDKGQRACVAAFVSALREGTPMPIPFSELAEVTNATFDMLEALEIR